MNPEKFQPTWATKSKLPAATTAAAAAVPAAAVDTKPAFPANEAQQLGTTTARPIIYHPKPPPSPHRRRRGFCCSCVLFTTLILFTLLVLAVLAAAVLYAVYHPRRPTFSLSSLHVSALNLSSPTAFSSSLALSVSAHNPNSKIEFSYDPISVSVFSSSTAAQIAAGRFPAFVHPAKNTTHLTADVTSKGLRVSNGEISALKSSVKREKGLDLEIQMETKVRVRFGKSSTKKMGFRVSCNGIKANPNSKGKFTGSVKTSGVKCKGKLRLKIWKWNFSS